MPHTPPIFPPGIRTAAVFRGRPFNIQQQVDAFLRYPAIQQVDYEPAQNPTRLAVVYKTPRKVRCTRAE
jgi:hypothetical protein